MVHNHAALISPYDPDIWPSALQYL